MNNWYPICMVSLWLIPIAGFSQGPYCPGWACTANDVSIMEARLVNGSGNFIPEINCTEEDTIPDLFLRLTIRIASVTRYDVNLTGDILVNDIFLDNFTLCLGDLTGPDTIEYLIQEVPWPCDDSVTISAVISWQTGNFPGQECATCTTAGKCSRVNGMPVITPLACSFNVTNSQGTGVGTIHRALYCAGPGDTITIDNALAGDTIDLLQTWFISASNSPLTLECNYSPPPILYHSNVLFNVSNGGVLEIKKVNLIGGLNGSSYGNGIFLYGIYNSGMLKLQDVGFFQHPQLSTPGLLILNKNGGQLTISGAHVWLYAN